MNKTRTIVYIAFTILMGTSACQSKGGETSATEKQATDSVTVIPAAEGEKTITGIVKEISANNFSLLTAKGDTIVISTMGQEPDAVGRFSAGDSVLVNYIEEEEEPGLALIPSATKVVTLK